MISANYVFKMTINDIFLWQINGFESNVLYIDGLVKYRPKVKKEINNRNKI